MLCVFVDFLLSASSRVDVFQSCIVSLFNELNVYLMKNLFIFV